ncbi:related to 3-oxoadipate enol-lactonase II [Phialocephala subalpina]|uniref:Related to 3-oxoadipate enol-lactonase II n=1 Tax=Phialocephala subalpina TaxID=576137 RepID=A0A1L7XG03_9HELO|nr:related to 3-oxoadipate enol-lactonase II [Phialocephala subalpina]
MGLSNPSLTTLRDGRQLSYHLSGPDQSASTKGPIILLSNSLCTPYHMWHHFVPRLHELNFQVLQYNQIGHGESTVDPSTVDDTTFDTLADDVKQLLDSLKIQKLHAWVGISMGAATGIVFCAQNPGLVERLVICDTISCSPSALGAGDPFGPRVDAARSAGNLEATIEQTLARWFWEDWRKSHGEELHWMRSLMSKTKVEGFVACCAALRKMSFDLRPLFGKLGTSVDEILLVVGELDADLPQTMAIMRDGIQQGFEAAGKTDEVRLAIIKGAGHVSVVDGLEEYASVVTSFLTK